MICDSTEKLEKENPEKKNPKKAKLEKELKKETKEQGRDKQEKEKPEKMDLKKTQAPSPSPTSDAQVKGQYLFKFIGDIKEEIQKVAWTTKEELQVYTKVIVATTFAFGLGIYIVDLVLKDSLKGLSFLLKWIAS